MDRLPIGDGEIRAWAEQALEQLIGVAQGLLARITELTIQLKEGVDMAEDALQSAFDDLSARVDAAVAAETQGAQELADMAAKLQEIPIGTTVTADMLEGLATNLSNATDALSAAANAASPPSTPPADQPTVTPEQPAA
jgi:CTP:molybdopterin cytidylyltransferase MocA